MAETENASTATQTKAKAPAGVPPIFPSGMEAFDAPNKPGIHVSRTRPARGARGAAAQTGHCGTIPATGHFLDVVADRWGGGLYTFRGTRDDGTPYQFSEEVPGPSLPLRDLDLDLEELDLTEAIIQERIDRALADHGILPAAVGFQQGRPAPQGGWWGQGAYGAAPDPQASRLQEKVDRLRAENARLKDQLAELREKFREQEMAARLAEMEARLTKGSGGSSRLEEIQVQMRADQQRHEHALRELEARRSAVPEVDPTARALDMFREFAKVSGLGSKGGVSQISDMLGIIEQVKAIAGGDGDDGSWTSLAKLAWPDVREVLQAKAEELREAKEAQAKADNPSATKQPQQIPQQPTEEATTEVSMVEVWARVLTEIGQYMKQGASPEGSFIAVRGFTRGLGHEVEQVFVSSLASASPTIITSQLQQLLEAGAVEGDAATAIQEFLRLVSTPTGTSWLEQFIAAAG